MLGEIRAAFKNDPAARNIFEVLMYQGIWAIWFHRIAHFLFRLGIPVIPRFISQVSRFLTGIEIHPGAKLGKEILIDHGSGVVIGETAEVGDRCLIYHGVTLGGTGLRNEKRHPTIGAGTVIGAGAKVLGNIRIGENCRIGSNSVVLKDVPPNSTVVGIPGRVIIQDGKKLLDDLNWGDLPDPVEKTMVHLIHRIIRLENQLKGK
jgi:serine O-acetyltransferase